MGKTNGSCARTASGRGCLSAKVTYRFVTNKTADCGTRDTCQDVQIFNGTRPPKVSP